MKAIGYQPSVSLKVGQAPARQASGNSLVYGDGSGYDALGRGIGEVRAVVEKEFEEDMVADITAAKNEYDKRISDLLYNDENGLMNRKLGNARGIAKEYETEEQKIRQDIMTNMLPKYEKAHVGFTKLVDPQTQRDFNNVRNYSLKQKDEYRDVNFTNSVNFSMENAQHYYKDPSAVSGVLDDIRKTTWANYAASNGAEWCAMKYDELESKLVQATVETAIANGDRDAARELISVFGDRVPPVVLNRYRKGIMDADKDDAILNTAEQIYKDIGGDMTKLDAALAKRDTLEVASGGTYYKMKPYFDEMEGTKYKYGGNGKDGIDCSAFTQQAYAAAGEQIPRTAAEQMRWTEQNGRFVPNDGKYTPQAGDLVFIVNTNPKNKTAYKGVTHVGIVTDRGTIMQSGSSKGVGEVPMSAFAGKIMGYGKAAGTQRVPMSASEKQELKNKVLAIHAQKERIENERIQNRVNSIEDAMWDLYQAGVTDPKQYEAILKRYADDPEVYRKGKRVLASFTSSIVSGSSSGGGGGRGSYKVSRDSIAMIKDAIDMGEFLSEDKLTDALDAEGVSPADRRSLVGYYRKAQNDAVEWSSLKADFQRDFGKNEGLWLGAKEAAQDFIQDYVGKNGRQPSYAQIKDALYKATVKPENSMFGNNSGLADFEKMGISPATMRAMGISNARPNGDGTVTVTYPNGSTAKMKKDKFDTMVERNS